MTDAVPTLPYGLRCSPQAGTLGVIGAVEQSMSGNAVLRVGNTLPDQTGWEQVSHVVLTPEEREKLIADLIAQR